MLRLAIVFLVIALIAAFLGFGGVASPLVGRGEDTLRHLPGPRRALVPGARVQEGKFLGVTWDVRT